MRFFEFSNANELVLIFKNIIGRASSQKAPAKFNWAAINNMLKSAGKEEIDYEAFKAIYDSSPLVQNMVQNFNADGIEFKVPGAPSSQEPDQGAETSQDAVDKIAASAAPKQLSAQA